MTCKYNLIALLLLCWTYPVFALDIAYQYDDLNRLRLVNYGNGQQTIAYTYDDAGNILSKTIFVAEQLPPALNITSPQEGAVFVNNAVDIIGTANDANRGESGITAVTINGQAVVDGVASGGDSANWSLAVNLHYGVNMLEVIATDGSPFANKSTQTLTLTFQPPFVDSDADTMDDNWEQYYFNAINIANTISDFDKDGVSDVDEYQFKSDPLDSLSRAINIQLALSKGFQPLFYPLNANAITSAFELLTQLNTQDSGISQIQGLNSHTGLFHTAYIDTESGNLTGDNFILAEGEAVLAMVQSDKHIPISGSVNCKPLDLFTGVNIVGFSCLPQDYTAFQLLSAIGDKTVIASIQRFNRETGSFETAAYQEGNLVGSDYTIQIGEAYWLHMLADVPALDVID